MSLLQIEKLSLSIGGVPILQDVDVSVEAGETVALVGESGSGKSMTALSVIRLLPDGAATSGSIAFDGTDLLAASERDMHAVRGRRIGMIFQEPMTALNPLKTIGEQVAEGIRWHARASRADAEARARKMLDRVGMPEGLFPLSRYPHQLSGGQRQRVMIAIACALKPQLLIADEPTTALDVVLQAEILDLLRDLVHDNRMGLLLISHDLAVVADMADRITILRRGEVTEAGDTVRVLSEQVHPYTRQLTLASTHVPTRPPSPLRGGSTRSVGVGVDQDGAPPQPLPPRPTHFASQSSFADPPRKGEGDAALLTVSNITRDYPGRRTSRFSRAAPTRAVNDVSLSIQPAQSVALIGRSGCGKSTLARIILALDEPTSGSVTFMGERITGRDQASLHRARRNLQVVFQDPYGSFDPRQNAERLVTEPIHLLDRQPDKAERRAMAEHALHEVGLLPSDLQKYPHEFSGGQRQRLSIARAIITRPRLVVADEPVSALDVSIRAQILDLFAELNQRLGIAFLFITHDLTVARAITDEVLVMEQGRIVERGKTAEVLSHPQSPAGRALVGAAPDLKASIARRMREQG